MLLIKILQNFIKKNLKIFYKKKLQKGSSFENRKNIKKGSNLEIFEIIKKIILKKQKKNKYFSIKRI